MSLSISSIQINHLLVLVGLLRLDGLAVFIETEILAVRILQQCELHCPLAEFLIGEHAIFDKQLQIIPFLLQGLTLIGKDIFQSVSHFLGDVA